MWSYSEMVLKVKSPKLKAPNATAVAKKRISVLPSKRNDDSPITCSLLETFEPEHIHDDCIHSTYATLWEKVDGLTAQLVIKSQVWSSQDLNYSLSHVLNFLSCTPTCMHPYLSSLMCLLYSSPLHCVMND